MFIDMLKYSQLDKLDKVKQRSEVEKIIGTAMETSEQISKEKKYISKIEKEILNKEQEILRLQKNIEEKEKTVQSLMTGSKFKPQHQMDYLINFLDEISSIEEEMCKFMSGQYSKVSI